MQKPEQQQPEANNQQVAIVKAVDGKLPEGTIVNYGEAIVVDLDEQIDVIRKYIRAKVLKQYGITGINHATVSQLPLGFNKQNVQTRLQLPKVKTDVAGNICELVPDYYKRVLPNVRKWFKDALFNSGLTVEIVETMD